MESLSVVFEDLVKILGLKFTINQEVSRWSKDVKSTYFYDVKIEGVSNELQRVIADGLAPILYSSWLANVLWICLLKQLLMCYFNERIWDIKKENQTVSIR